VGLGPAIFITSLKPTFQAQPNSYYEFFPVRTDGSVNPQTIDYRVQLREFDASQKSTVSIGLGAELGLRYMITKFLSVETSVKYRYTSFSTTYDVDILGYTHQLTYAPQLNLFSVQAGVAYHF
jgi:outer membrane protein W